jgi:type I restriction enzyme R subunit
MLFQQRKAKAHLSQYGFGGKVNEKTGEMSYGFSSSLRPTT